jgi:hypothetical protein
VNEQCPVSSRQAFVGRIQKHTIQTLMFTRVQEIRNGW